MIGLHVKFVLDQLDDSLPSRLRGLLREIPAVIDHRINFSRVQDYRALSCVLYLDEERLTKLIGRELLSILFNIRSNIESLGTRCLYIIVGDYDPPFNLLRERNGLWTADVQNQELWRWLTESGGQAMGEWLFLPFHPDDSDYEPCKPDEKLMAFGHRINGSPKRASVPITLKIRMEEGHSLTEYVSAAFGASLQSFTKLGGENVMMTTLLQMNDRLDMVNHYSERLTRSEALNLFSLSAMNLSLADINDETNIAVLISSGKLILEEIKLGG